MMAISIHHPAYVHEIHIHFNPVSSSTGNPSQNRLPTRFAIIASAHHIADVSPNILSGMCHKHSPYLPNKVFFTPNCLLNTIYGVWHCRWPKHSFRAHRISFRLGPQGAFLIPLGMTRRYWTGRCSATERRKEAKSGKIVMRMVVSRYFCRGSGQMALADLNNKSDSRAKRFVVNRLGEVFSMSV